jgi:glycosyltransferase involved in cell wall biosynthesis
VTPLVLPELFPKGIKGSINLYLQKQKIKKADKIITDSICSKNDISHYLEIPEEKIEVVYLACDETYKKVIDGFELERVKKKYNLPQKFLLKVGDINKHKNFKILFDSLSRLPEDVHLALVGKALAPTAPQIPELKEIREDIQNFSLQKRVHILGFVPDEDIAAVFSLAYVTIQNSLYEGFGLPALESMACGTPVISSETGSLPEIVGSAGIMINPYDVLETTNTIDKVWNYDDKKYAEAEERSQLQSRKFSLSKMVNETVAVYESIKTIPQ